MQTENELRLIKRTDIRFKGIYGIVLNFRHWRNFANIVKHLM